MINTHAYCNVKCKFCVWRELSLNGFPVEPRICSYMYTYRVKRSTCSMRWTQSKLLIWRTSYRFQVKVTIRCVYIVVFWGINLELAIIKLMLNAVYCKIYKKLCLIYICLRKSSGYFRKSFQTRKVVRFAMKKTQCFFFGKIRFRKKFELTLLKCSYATGI